MNVKLYKDRLIEAGRRAGFSVATYGTIGEIDLPVLERTESADAPSVYISTGVHGNEPAGPMAVLDLLKRRAFPQGLNFTLFPLINPDGLMAETRENAEGIDLNRDYGQSPRSRETRAQLDYIGERQFDLTLCLHEDDDGQGFYIYAHVEPETGVDYEDLALRAAEPWTGIDPRDCIDDMPAQNGRMRPPMSVMETSRQDLPEALRLLFQHGSKLTFTTETPSTFGIERRIRAQCAVVEAILGEFSLENR